MECHHHHTRTRIFHLSLRLVSRCFLAAPQSLRVRGWPVPPAKFLSDRGTTGKFQLLPSLFPVGKAATNVYAQSLIFCMLWSVTCRGGNGWITGMANRIMARSSTGYQEFGFVKEYAAQWVVFFKPSLVHFQCFLSNLTPWKAYLCNAKR